ncbi:histidine kinase [Rhizobium sp. Root708]|uniref:hybrid sensor histidine kinase/response regulator n=1 Tax=Rhizobium sp. Root708 TaxID=1736592 RepID=UPI0006F79B2E|nr:PAS domain-containing sensor histidine kinase [Rhizobium sp. Root708]KRB49275.1 histidine kinase [Rhizobium sp. Root708]
MTETTRISIEDRYRLLIDNITDYAVYMLDVDGYVSSWNPGANRFKGYPESEILGKHFSRFYTPKDRASGLPERALATAAAQGRFEAEGWRVRKDGRQFWAHVVIDPIRDSTGALIGYAKITRDLSERKNAEDNLQKSEEQLRLLVQGVTDYAIFMLDPKGHVTTWNAGARRIKGYEPDEIIGRHFSEFYTAEDRADGLPALALETAAREGRFEREGWRLRKDGTRFFANVIIDAIHADDGGLLGFAKITRDITEKRNAQEALDRAQQELFQIQKMEAVGQLTGGMAHDFNNLLMAVLGSLEIARKRAGEDHAVVELIDNAIQGAKRGAVLTQRLLAFSRKQALKLESVEVSDLVRGMAELLQRAIGPSLEIATRFPLVLPLVRADINQLETAVLNLVVNARDAMPAGGTITIAARQAALPGSLTDQAHYVCLSVEDSGEGMDQATLSKATDPFFTTKGVGKGTGLGLSMVQGLMEQAGGKLALISSPGAGTTAELWLPVADTMEPAIPTAADVAPSTPPPADHPSLAVLVVDDDSLVLMNTVLMLEDLGHSTMQAGSGAEALQILEQGPLPDIVITDHAMPRMTGAELAREVSHRFPEVSLVLATGYAELPSDHGGDLPRLSKPFTQADLSEMLLNVAARELG